MKLGNMGKSWVEFHLPCQVLKQNLPAGKGTRRYLDTTMDTKYEEITWNMGETLFMNYRKNQRRIEAASSLIPVNAGPGGGVVKGGNITSRHQHGWGVANVLGLPEDADLIHKIVLNQIPEKDIPYKLWDLWEPTEDALLYAHALPTVTIKQYSGDVLWLPPGWHHKVSLTVTLTHSPSSSSSLSPSPST
jgi:hypothetical protein